MEKMFKNSGGQENFIDDFLNSVGPLVGSQTAIGLKYDAMLFVLREILIEKGLISGEDFDIRLKNKFGEFEKMVRSIPLPSTIQTQKK